MSSDEEKILAFEKLQRVLENAPDTEYIEIRQLLCGDEDLAGNYTPPHISIEWCTEKDEYRSVTVTDGDLIDAINKITE